ncbi:MAG TPA: AI-2E family transporter [Methylovirgula sp.]|nr:AI-2E family transporter [Methylovirgula sp.]
MSGPESEKPSLVEEEARVEGAANRTTLFFVIAVIGFVAHEIQWALLPFVIAGLLAYVCTPLIELLKTRARLPRWAAASAVFLGLVILAAIFSALGIPPLVRELQHLVVDLPGTFHSLAKTALGGRTITLFGQEMNADQLAAAGAQRVRDWIGAGPQIGALGSILLAGGFGLILVLVLLFYFLLNGPGLMRGVLWLAPPDKRPLIRTIWLRLDPILKRYFIGVLLILAYATGAAYIGLGLVLGLGHALFLAFLTGLLEIVPIIGPAASAIIAGLVAVRYAKGIGLIIGYATYAVALRISIDQLFGPLALGTAARLHPVLIIFCFLVGGVLFGLPGIILAVPIALTVRVTLSVLRGEAQEVDPHTGRAS